MHIFDLARADMEVKEGKKFWHSMYVYRCLGQFQGRPFFYFYVFSCNGEEKWEKRKKGEYRKKGESKIVVERERKRE